MVKLYSQYLADNEDFLKFIDKVSDNTGKLNRRLWLENLDENHELFLQHEWACAKLQDAEKGKASILMGASPAIKNQVETLRGIQDDPDFVLCGISSNTKWLLENGIKPKYVLTVDADKDQGECLKGLDMDKTRDVTLIANIYASPQMLRDWRGPLYFLAFMHSDRKLGRKQERLYAPLNGTGKGFPVLMSQYNILTAFVFSVLCSNILLFVGNELSFKDEDSTYYVDRKDPRDNYYKRPHMDIYGNMVSTTYGLMALKIALEAFLGAIERAGWFFNCTEAGIFGITKRYKDYHTPWITQLKLIQGIAQARHIMRTGQPYYSPGSIVKVPSLTPFVERAIRV